uniref:Uncharacterized protein n=1 Tax=viral metagenome TaxID=1070528 RepID=A0A6H2A3Z5_9ZZZZ
MIQLMPTSCKPNKATYYTLYKDTAKVFTAVGLYNSLSKQINGYK